MTPLSLAQQSASDIIDLDLAGQRQQSQMLAAYATAECHPAG